MSDAGSDAGSVAPEVVEDVEVADASKGGQMSVEDALQEVLKVRSLALASRDSRSF
jgi:hypothetical protein